MLNSVPFCSNIFVLDFGTSIKAFTSSLSNLIIEYNTYHYWWTVGDCLVTKEDLNMIPSASIMSPKIIALQQLCLTSDLAQVLSYLGQLNGCHRMLVTTFGRTVILSHSWFIVRRYLIPFESSETVNTC